jgi:hypothetical protein
MKLRLAPILISMLVTSAVLFGGWFAYRSAAMESPLSDTIRDIDGVKAADMHISNDSIRLELTLEPDADLRAIMARIRQDGEKIIKNRKIKLSIKNQSSAELDAWWSSMLFEVAEAMENRRYSDIPEALDRNLDRLPGLTAFTSMDEDFVYIRLTREDQSKFIVLPRIPAQLGVWGNE